MSTSNPQKNKKVKKKFAGKQRNPQKKVIRKRGRERDQSNSGRGNAALPDGKSSLGRWPLNAPKERKKEIREEKCRLGQCEEVSALSVREKRSKFCFEAVDGQAAKGILSGEPRTVDFANKRNIPLGPLRKRKFLSELGSSGKGNFELRLAGKSVVSAWLIGLGNFWFWGVLAAQQAV